LLEGFQEKPINGFNLLFHFSLENDYSSCEDLSSSSTLKEMLLIQ